MKGLVGRTRAPTRHGAAGIAVALLAGLAISGSAPAKDGPTYKGPISDSKGKIEFSVERHKGARRVMHFHANGLPYTCPDGNVERASFGLKRMRVREREFAGYTYFGDFRGSEFAEVEGRLRRHGRARGIVTYQDGFDGVGICESGDIGWSAKR